jgi:hypothetical protein
VDERVDEDGGDQADGTLTFAFLPGGPDRHELRDRLGSCVAPAQARMFLGVRFSAT